MLVPDNAPVKAVASDQGANCVTIQWQTATASGHTGCVEARMHMGRILVRDSKLGDASPVLMFTLDEWAAFLDGASKGEFDLPPATS